MSESDVIGFLLILTRVSAFVAYFTLFSFQQLPRLVKIGLAVGLSVFWFSQMQATFAESFTGGVGILDGGIMLMQQFLIGVMLAIVMNLFFMPAKIAGAYIGQELGLSLASISNPGTPDSATLITRVFETLTIMVFFALNFHYFIILVIDHSFKQLWNKVDILNLPTEHLVASLNVTTSYGLNLAGPIAVLLAVVTITIAILNRVAPTLNLFSVGMSLRTGIGIFCIFIFLPVLFNAIRGYLYRVQENIEQLLIIFAA